MVDDSGPGPGASLYERYKDALRRGHVAALRGWLDAAIEAYGEASTIAPDRALPHASVGGILVRLGRVDDALAAYERALDLAPNDESALRGAADALTNAGRRAEAADALDRLAEALDAAGRLPDASDATRRALELAESEPRRRHLEELAGRLRGLDGDEAARRALGHAQRVLGPTAAGIVAEPAPAAPPPAEPEPATELEPGAEPGLAPSDLAPEPEPAEPEPETAAAEPEPEPEPAVPEPEPEPVPPPDGLALGRAAEEALHAGDLDAARVGLLAAAAAHRTAGRPIAAIDACYLAMAVAPADADLHLLLAELYLERGWRTLAADKLVLLGRLAELGDDRVTRERLCALVSDRLPDDPRFAELCA